MEETDAEEKINKIRSEKIRLHTLTQFLLMVKTQKQREKANKLNKPLSVRFHNLKSFSTEKGCAKSINQNKKEDQDIDRQGVQTVFKNENKKKTIDASDLAKQFKWPYDLASEDWNPKDAKVDQ